MVASSQKKPCRLVPHLQNFSCKGWCNWLPITASLLMVLVGCTKQEAPDEGKLRQAEYARLYQIETADVQSFDGVRLNGVLIRAHKPAAKLPTVLIRTPYSIWDDELAESDTFVKGFLNAGYAVLLQNERGRYGSTGRYYKTIPNPREDGVATLDWIVRQPWSTGRVGTFGCSSSAENQLDLALAKHPAHVAMIPRSAAVAMTEAQATNVREPGQTRRGGVFWLGWASWFYYYGKLDVPNSSPVGDPTPADALADDWPDASKGFPQIDLMKRLGVQPTEFEDFINRPIQSASWSEGRISDRDDIQIPTLWMSSWFDYTPQLEIGVFEANRARAEVRKTNDHKLIVATGLHCQQSLETEKSVVGDRAVGDARLDYVRRAVEWFDAFVKENAVARTKVGARPAVSYYDNGAQRWSTDDNWPLSGAEQRFCLGAKDNSLSLSNADELCTAQVGSTSYRHDPFRPVPTMGGGGYAGDLGTRYPLGVVDQRQLTKRSDVKTFLSKPLDKDIETYGNVVVKLWASSNAPDFDLVAKLVEVLPDGRIFNVADTALRARYRKGYDQKIWMKADVPEEFNLPNMVIGHTFRKGSQIGLQVASSNWPQFSINGSTKTLPELETKPQPARITLWTGGRFAAALALPIKSDDKPR
jgi:uncharacterized protein